LPVRRTGCLHLVFLLRVSPICLFADVLSRLLVQRMLDLAEEGNNVNVDLTVGA